jgi:hypothetical protein
MVDVLHQVANLGIFAGFAAGSGFALYFEFLFG